ncbi:MAG TPA: WhiB family transcriptional regulator [Pseudonocardia sp.]|jgi:hypothetical protein
MLPQPQLPSGILAALRTMPELVDASCVGMAEQFDDLVSGEHHTHRAARHRAAVRICHRCPAFDACEQLAATVPARELSGIWAGRVRGAG